MSLVMQEFDLGDAPRAINKFRNFDGVLTDPTTVTVKLRKGDGTVVTKIFGTDSEVIKEAVGIYHMDIDTGVPGTWTVRWEGTGTVKAAIEQRFKVKDSDFV